MTTQAIPKSILNIEIPQWCEDPGLPIINTPKDLSGYIQPIYIIHDYMKNVKVYDELRDLIYQLVNACFEKKDCIRYPVKFKFYTKDQQLHTLPLRHFLINLFLWRPLIEVHPWVDVMDESYIFDCESMMNPKGLNEYINTKTISTLIEHNIKTASANRMVSDALFDLNSISNNFSNMLGLTFGTESFLYLYNNNERFKELMNLKFPDSAQPNEIEKTLDEATKEIISILCMDQSTPLGKFFRAKTGIKDKQVCEFLINGGCNPDLTGKTIPRPLNTNMMMGANKPSELYINGSGARKSQIMSKKVMGLAGYFAKIVLLLVLTVVLSRSTYDCGSKHYLHVHVDNIKILKKYNKRYYKVNDDEDLRCLNDRKDTNLIGKTILVRSPATCCANNGVCHVCYGKNAMLSLDISEGSAGYGSQEITKVVNQMILSAKHLLSTSSESIMFNPEFYRFMNLVSGDIIPIISENTEVEDILDWAIYVNKDDIEKTDEMDDLYEGNAFIPSGKFYVKNLKTGETIKMQSEGNKELLISEETLKAVVQNKGLLKFKDMEDNQCIFGLDIMNNELTKPLYDIMNLLNKKRDKEYTIDEIVQYFTGLLIEAGIDAHALQAELIISALIRDPRDLSQRPDFTTKKVPNYTILTISQAIDNSNSPILGLAYQNIKKQLMSDSTFFNKKGSSYLDDIFRTKIKFNRNCTKRKS